MLVLLFVQLWDIRKKGAIHTFQNTYQVLAVTFNDTSDQILSGGIDNDIKVRGSDRCRKTLNDASCCHLHKHIGINTVQQAVLLNSVFPRYLVSKSTK